MKSIWNVMQVGIAAVGAWFGWFLGGCDGFLYALIALTVLDYLSGVMRAVLDRRLSSAVGFRGIFKKVLIFIMVVVGHIIDTQLMGEGGMFRNTVIFFYLSNEGVSLLENAGYIGLPIPQKLKDILAQLHGKEE